jgi:hypothetical protein
MWRPDTLARKGRIALASEGKIHLEGRQSTDQTGQKSVDLPQMLLGDQIGQTIKLRRRIAGRGECARIGRRHMHDFSTDERRGRHAMRVAPT